MNFLRMGEFGVGMSLGEEGRLGTVTNDHPDDDHPSWLKICP